MIKTAEDLKKASDLVSSYNRLNGLRDRLLSPSSTLKLEHRDKFTECMEEENLTAYFKADLTEQVSVRMSNIRSELKKDWGIELEMPK